MDSFLFTALLILTLIVLAGIFLMSETAVLSVRRGRIKQLAESGDRRARALMRLYEDSDRTFSAINLSIMLIQGVAAALAGALAVEHLAPALAGLFGRMNVPAMIPWARATALLGVVGALVVLIGIAGRLVPRALGYVFSEKIALLLAAPIARLARLTRPLQRLFMVGLRALLRLSRQGDAAHQPERLAFLLQEDDAQVVERPEQELIHGVYEFTERVVREVMVPRPKIHAISADASAEEILRTVVESGYSRYPVYTRSVDDTQGILYNKDLLERLARREPVVLREMLHPAHFVPENKKVSQLLKEMQRRRLGMSMVVNEYGNVEGLVTLEDLLEEIVGEIQDEYDMEERPVQRMPDGTLLADASLNLRELKEDYDLPFEESPQYETLAGFMLSRLERVPKGGEVIEERGHRLTVVEMDGKRIQRVKIEPARE